MTLPRSLHEAPRCTNIDWEYNSAPNGAGHTQVTPERWQEVKKVLAGALERAPEERRAYLDQACTEPALRREVESLIAAHGQGDSTFGDRPPMESREALSSGAKVGPYEIVARLGAGGMGVVYKASDTRLRRFVALKFLPDEVARDPRALARFTREAQLASSLNHPNICTIYDIGEQDERSFITMELLEGQTLEARIGGRPLPLETFLNLALQITDALEAAHERGVVHRDLKPSNIFVTGRGDAKLLDFGLAKHVRPQSLGAADAVTISGSLTMPGQIVGTIAYMSPEQVQERDVDARSDIFSLGAVLYEMATGRRAFPGDSAANVIAEILRGEPKAAQSLNPELPDDLPRIICKALEKDPGDRYQSANDLMIDLRRLKRESSSGGLKGRTVPVGLARLRRKSIWIPAIAAVILLLILIAAENASQPVSGPLDSEQITFSADLKDGPIVTDGTRLYFQSEGNPVEMSVEGGPSAPLRTSISGMSMLDVSPDATEMLALKQDLNVEIARGSIWSVPVLGGYPRMLENHLARSAHFSPDGRLIVYADLNSVYVSSRDGSNMRKIWDAPDYTDLPYFSPDSRRIRVTVGQSPSPHPPAIWELNVDGSSPHRLAVDWPDDADQENGQWTPDGRHFIFVSRREGLGNIYELLRPPWFEFWREPTAARLTAGQIDVLAVTPSRDSAGLFIIGRIAQGAMQVLEPAQKRWAPFLDGLAASVFVISPDKKWMVYADYPRHYLWRSKLDGSEKLQLTDFYSAMPQWSPDSKQIAFSDWKQLYLISVDGGTPEKLISQPNNEVAPTWWPDGKSIAFNDFPFPGHINGIKVLDLASRKISIMPGSEGFYVPSWSPDGKHMVAIAQNPSRMVLYSTESGTWKDLRKFEVPWGYWVWSNDSKSVYIAMASAEPGFEPGVYQLAIANGAWNQIAKFDGLTLSNSGAENFPSLTLDGRPAIMNDTSVVQIYSAKWN
jgi:eukaryotic-like serine/threonine-protein kinase